MRWQVFAVIGIVAIVVALLRLVVWIVLGTPPHPNWLDRWFPLIFTVVFIAVGISNLVAARSVRRQRP
ncbi:MAG: hypothetical protein HY996_03820 [Micrococcales bacterium]|nr:hypothetical protein [Micrococcales bacterium]